MASDSNEIIEAFMCFGLEFSVAVGLNRCDQNLKKSINRNVE